ncbi:MAG: hypothetical protein K8F54_06265 [Altibacter sp.]|uniref:hypothetical protein n=1 Tax=Altibacter sp. TaxID=2024823 RepID=UPI001D644CCA|nr:hypothetical protein [Altibacter sp.]MBZ0327192.1 hypothetical protein [Altibacter sp.]
MNHILTYTKPVSPLKLIFGAVIILGAFYIIVFNSLLFGLFMIGFAVYLTSTTGSQFNMDNNMYRNIWSLFGLHFGSWQASPKFEYISVFKGRQRQRVNSLGASTSFSDEVYLVNLFYQRNKHLTFYRTFDKADAFKVAKHFHLVLYLDILDATEREQTWIRKEDVWEAPKKN